MQLTDEQIQEIQEIQEFQEFQEFQDIRLKQYGEHLSKEKAIEYGTDLLRLVELVLAD